jgi:hypothetical protein
MPQNNWAVGQLYPPPNGLSNIKWSQPGGPGTLVYPQQQSGGAYESIQPFNEFSGVFRSPCGHSMNEALVQREYDFENETSVALICCELCGYVVYTLAPFEAALSTVYQPQLPV